MPPEPVNHSASVVVQTTATSLKVPPAWTGEAILLLSHARQSGLWQSLVERIRVPRGRMGRYETPDFLLLLLLYALGWERTLEQLFVALRPVAALLAAVVMRRVGPSRAALSRWLAAVSETGLAVARAVFFEDLLAHGLHGEHVGGLVDRCGVRHVFFDADGTREVHRQRALTQDAAHPPVRRRFDRSCAPGYTGRKRGETQRTRTVLQQAHTREWLGSWGHAGNGDVKAEFAAALAATTRYLAARGLALAQGVLRLDGLYGYAWAVAALSAAGLGFVVRCSDYALLTNAVVVRVLAQGAVATYTAPETGACCEVFEVAALPWAGMRVRLVITRRRLASGQVPAVGVRRGEWAYELFVTDRTAPGLTCTDVLSLYHARGGFESTLAHEDHETGADRWASAQPAGQELWQLCAQWVWNARLRLGIAANDPGARTTIWAEALPPLPRTDATTEIPRGASATCGTICAAHARGQGQYAGTDFTWTSTGLLCCPAGALLRPIARQVQAHAVRVIFAASVTDCFGCSHAGACRGAGASWAHGRRVSVLYAPARDNDAGPNQPVLWRDVPARALRTQWPAALRHQALVLGPSPWIAPPAPPRWTRARRARRRLTWTERYARNALPTATAPWPVMLHGVPAGLSQLLRTHERLEAVA